MLMGLLTAASDAWHGVLGDQWKDFYTVPNGLTPTSAVFAAVPRNTNTGRGTNTRGSVGVITNGSRIVVPEGYALILTQEGGISDFTLTPGPYVWRSDAPDSQSVLTDGNFGSLIRASWERFKFGGRPSSEQHAFFVSLKELPNNRFGTASEIYWDDAYLNAQVGAHARGTYTMKITDPLLFVQNWLPAMYLRPDAIFDFTDPGNAPARQLFSEVVGSLAQALSLYTNDPRHGNRMVRIQQDTAGFARSLSAVVEQNYQWRSARGLEIVSTAILGLEYDEATRELLKTVQRADALQGARGNSNLQASVAAGIQAAGQADGAAGILGLAVASNAAGVGVLHQPTSDGTSTTEHRQASDPVARLTKLKELLDADLITQADYDTAKARVLGS